MILKFLDKKYYILHGFLAYRSDAQDWIDMGFECIGLEFPFCSFPGGYPIFYITKDNGILCPTCANENISLTADENGDPQWSIRGQDINYEDIDLHCDHCNKLIEAAYV